MYSGEHEALFRWPDDALTELGKENLVRVIATLRQDAKALSHQIENIIPDELRTLRGLTRESVEAESDLAIDFPALLAGMQGIGEDLHRLDSRAHDYGHTTFRMCGACKYGTGRSIKGVGCAFYNAVSYDSQAAPYDSPCLLRKEGEVERVKNLLEKKQAKQSGDWRRERNALTDQIVRFLRLKRQAPSRPLLPMFRRHKTYLYGDRVLVYTADPIFAENQHRWVFATVLRDDSAAIVCLLDLPLLPADTWKTDDWIRQSWNRTLWKTYSDSPFIVTEEELRELGSLSPENPLRRLWVNSYTRPYANPLVNHGYYELDREAFKKRISTEYILRSPRTDGRLMSAREAAEILEFDETPPRNAEEIIGNYRVLLLLHEMPEVDVERAKSTLLIRLYGTTELGG